MSFLTEQDEREQIATIEASSRRAEARIAAAAGDLSPSYLTFNSVSSPTSDVLRIRSSTGRMESVSLGPTPYFEDSDEDRDNENDQSGISTATVQTVKGKSLYVESETERRADGSQTPERPALSTRESSSVQPTSSASNTQQLPLFEIIAVIFVVIAVVMQVARIFEKPAAFSTAISRSGTVVDHSATPFGKLDEQPTLNYVDISSVALALAHPFRLFYQFFWSMWYVMAVLLLMFAARAVFSSTQRKREHTGQGAAPSLKLLKGDLIKATIQNTRHEFELLKRLGKGAYGEVWMTVKKDTGIIYAIKILDKSYVARTDVVNRVIEENNIMQTIYHPFVVRLAYAFQDTAKLFLVQDYVGGGDLFAVLERQDEYRIPEDAVQFYIAEVTLALAYLHSKDVIYRDLKPENILLGVDDFGTATRKRKEGERLTSIVGTPDYMAPELISREGHGQEVDWWSLGILMYQMLYGRTPFSSPDFNRVFYQIKNCTVDFPETPFVSAHAKELLHRLLEKDPGRRLGRNGPQEVQNHPFFKGLSFEKLVPAPQIVQNRLLRLEPPSDFPLSQSKKRDHKFQDFNTFVAEEASKTGMTSLPQLPVATPGEAILRRKIELLFHYRAWCVVDREKWNEILDPDCRLEMPLTSILRATIIKRSSRSNGPEKKNKDSEVIEGVEAMIDAVNRERKRMGHYVDLPKRIDIDSDMIFKGNKTMFTWMIHAKHLLEPREVSSGGMAMVEFSPVTGKITEAVWRWDILKYVEQLGGFEVIDELIKQRQQVEIQTSSLSLTPSTSGSSLTRLSLNHSSSSCPLSPNQGPGIKHEIGLSSPLHKQSSGSFETSTESTSAYQLNDIGLSTTQRERGQLLGRRSLSSLQRPDEEDSQSSRRSSVSSSTLSEASVCHLQKLSNEDFFPDRHSIRQNIKTSPPSPNRESQSLAVRHTDVKEQVIALMNMIFVAKDKVYISEEFKESPIWLSLVSPDAVELFDYNAGGVFKGLDGLFHYMKRIRKAIGGLMITYKKVEAEKNTVRVDWFASGSYHGKLDVKKTRVEFSGVAVFGINECGQITHITNNWDALSFLHQLNSAV